MLLTALPPAPPTPNTVIFGFSSLISGIFRLIVMASSSVLTPVGRPRVPPASFVHVAAAAAAVA